jgi:CheY-like chemotaxis protein
MCHTLIIEDEPLLALHMADLAEEAGATSVDLADTECGAVDLAMRKKPDMILSDVRLLIGTGPSAVATIRQALGMVPVIFVTANPQRCTPCDPPALVMGKPVRGDDLVREFRRLMANG